MYTASALSGHEAQPRRGYWWFVPREFGAWTMLVTGYLTTLMVADAFSTAALLLIPAVVFLLLAKEPVDRLLRAKAGGRALYAWIATGELAASAVAGVLAARTSHAALLYLLPILAVPPYAFAVLLGFLPEKWRTLRELVATTGLCLIVPGTWAALGLPADMAMLIVYFGLVLHFLYGVGFLRLQIVAAKTNMDAADVRQGTLLLAGSASLLTLLVVALSLFGYLPIWAAVPLLPQMARAYLWLGGQHPWLNMRRMGRQEVVLAVALMALFTLVAHA
ncbi:MAG: YwiC-like family protein [Thermaerobacter sp.]|nr:YwiC-like family protein [Thermaerobacter sp.]